MLPESIFGYLRITAFRIMSIGMMRNAINVHISHAEGESGSTLKTLPPNVTNTNCNMNIDAITQRKFLFLPMPSKGLICDVRAYQSL